MLRQAIFCSVLLLTSTFATMQRFYVDEVMQPKFSALQARKPVSRADDNEDEVIPRFGQLDWTTRTKILSMTSPLDVINTALTCKYLYALIKNTHGMDRHQMLAEHFISNIRPLHEVMVPYLKANKVEISSPKKRTRQLTCDEDFDDCKRQKTLSQSDGFSTISVSSDPISDENDYDIEAEGENWYEQEEEECEDYDHMFFPVPVYNQMEDLPVNHVHPRSPTRTNQPLPVTKRDMRDELSTPWNHVPMHLWVHQQLDEHNHPRGKSQY